MPIVLGLDQSANTGFCVGEPGAKVPRWGLWQVPDFAGHEGRTFWAFEKWLVNLIKSEGVTHVFWEGVYVPPQSRLDTNKLFKLVAYANAIQAACVDSDRGVSVEDAYVTISQWRQFFNGSAAGTTEYQKQLAIQSCAARGWLIDSHHVAEACGIWEFGCSLIDKNCRWLHRPRIRRQEQEQREKATWPFARKSTAKG